MTPAEMSAHLRAVCKKAPMIPVLVIEDAARAADLARALVAGGLPILEITLRTEAALAAITAMAAVEGAIVGAGTVLTPSDAEAAKRAGATFAVSPGATPELIDACIALDLPILPGAVTPSEAMVLNARGFDLLKFFPAEPYGGVGTLKALAGPLPRISFCPTGGITEASAPSYLALPTVPCVGGSWVAPTALVRAGDWAGITALAAKASALKG
ncbi:MAG: bifunctional 4-hydroxy-2-oxoglutarate aldolase/2-dehydro-3-deoxy-phosphogluconate aldolase [Rhodobacteraceae bacterium]|nr:bifunctional 4-hydroxy-2-oxoglutarate aldolase/2-dehydro-3-deoxy-phosphogluconate aldolase [Paracoccaceae bacterium]